MLLHFPAEFFMDGRDLQVQGHSLHENLASIGALQRSFRIEEYDIHHTGVYFEMSDRMDRYPGTVDPDGGFNDSGEDGSKHVGSVVFGKARGSKGPRCGMVKFGILFFGNRDRDPV